MNLFGFKRPSELNKILPKKGRTQKIQKPTNLTRAQQKGNSISGKTPRILYYMKMSSLKKNL